MKCDNGLVIRLIGVCGGLNGVWIRQLVGDGLTVSRALSSPCLLLRSIYSSNSSAFNSNTEEDDDTAGLVWDGPAAVEGGRTGATGATGAGLNRRSIMMA